MLALFTCNAIMDFVIEMGCGIYRLTVTKRVVVSSCLLCFLLFVFKVKDDSVGAMLFILKMTAHLTYLYSNL